MQSVRPLLDARKELQHGSDTEAAPSQRTHLRVARHYKHTDERKDVPDVEDTFAIL